MDANKLANIKRYILKKSGMTSKEIEEIKKTAGEPQIQKSKFLKT